MEFNDEWKIYKLENLFDIKAAGDLDKNTFSNDCDRIFKYPLYANALTNKGLIGFSSIAKYPKNSLTVTARGDLGKAFVRKTKFNASGRLLILQQKVNLDLEFISNYINGKLNIFIENTGVPQLTAPNFKTYKIKMPILEEQQKIGRFLSLINEKIELMEKKYHILTNYKKGVMQKLFNENVCSEVKENNNYSTKWNIATLDEISKINTGTKDLKDKIDNGIYPFFVRSAKIESINSYSYDGEAILIPGDGKIGEVYHYINGKFDYHQRVYKISDFDKKIKGKYVYYYLQRNFFNHALKYTAKATVDSLRLPIIKEMIIKFPHIKEQSKIVHFLENIDNKIDFLEQQLEKIKEFKKYLLQQMFV